jgi:hypothetical protein
MGRRRIVPVFGKVEPLVESIDRFFDPENWLEVENDDPTLGSCLVWNRALNDDGYGRFNVRYSDGTKRQFYTHRLRFALVIGAIPPGKELAHFCPNRACACEHHVFPLTHRENMMMTSRQSKSTSFAEKERTDDDS